MKIHNDNNSFNFHAGMTKQMKADILGCNPYKISREFVKSGIETNFKNNKVIAWCSLKCLELFKSLKLPLPNAIFVEDFNNLNVQPSLGFNNAAPTRLYKNKESITREMTIFFNEFPEENYSGGNRFWESINEYSDYRYFAGEVPTNSFLDTFIHEFSHAAHEGNLINTLGGMETLNFLKQALSDESCKNFGICYNNLFSNLCNYALTSSVEAVACDLTKRIAENMDKSIKIIPNILKNSPYKKLTIGEKIRGIKEEHTGDNVLRRTWYGKLV